MVVIRGRLTPEAGAVLMQALAAARETLYQRARGTDAASNSEDVAAETPSMPQQQADALALLAEAVLHHRIDPGAPGERYQVVGAFMKIDIDKLTEAELIDRNNRIVERPRLINEMRAHAPMLAFRIGDRASFQPDGHPLMTDMLARHKKKTVTAGSAGT
jgi:hypothetical protein